MKEIDYRDQGGSVTNFGGRTISSFYTPHGIKEIESNYITRIQNMHDEVKEYYHITRVKGTFIGRDGKEYESLSYVDKLVPAELNSGHGFGVKVVWVNGKSMEFKNGDNWPQFNLKTRKEDVKKLRKEIKEDIHLHQDIIDNLLQNLKSYGQVR